MREFVYLKDVTTVTLDGNKCNGCRTCLTVCPHAVFHFQEKKAQIVRKDHCMECGACAKNCKAGAIEVESGVGCANAIINAALGREGACCA